MSAPMIFEDYQAALAELRDMDPRTRKHNEDYEQCLRSEARHSLLHFSAYTWDTPDPYVVGRHTREITARLDQAVVDYRNGRSTYLIVTVPFRNGKSQIVSRDFPPYAFGRLQDMQPEMILGTYGQGLSNDMSRDAQDIIRSVEYQELFPIKIDPRKSGVEEWRIKDSRAKFKATGLTGGFIGKGANILIVDDYLSGREDAESEVWRNKSWTGFVDLFTRLAPVHIVVILATRWHVDDVIGRIKNKNNPKHEDYQANFPKYEIMHYPARSEDGSYLFPERYPDAWYEAQFGTLSPYRIASELQGDPEQPGGNLLKVDKIHFNAEMPDDLQYVRSWDLASTEEERLAEDPDYTFGICLAVRATRAVDLLGQTLQGADGKAIVFYELYIEDGRFIRAEAPKRDEMIRATALEDGPAVWQGVESIAGYKDKYTTLKSVLDGIRVVRKIVPRGTKVIRASVLESTFEAGNVYINGNREDPWVDLLVRQLGQFPNGAHDDGVDALVNAFELALTRWKESGGLEADDFARNAV